MAIFRSFASAEGGTGPDVFNEAGIHKGDQYGWSDLSIEQPYVEQGQIFWPNPGAKRLASGKPGPFSVCSNEAITVALVFTITFSIFPGRSHEASSACCCRRGVALRPWEPCAIADRHVSIHGRGGSFCAPTVGAPLKKLRFKPRLSDPPLRRGLDRDVDGCPAAAFRAPLHGDTTFERREGDLGTEHGLAGPFHGLDGFLQWLCQSPKPFLGRVYQVSTLSMMLGPEQSGVTRHEKEPVGTIMLLGPMFSASFGQLRSLALVFGIFLGSSLAFLTQIGMANADTCA